VADLATSYWNALVQARAAFLASRTQAHLDAMYGAASDYIANVGPLDDATYQELESYRGTAVKGLTIMGLTIPWTGVALVGGLLVFAIMAGNRRRGR
jgi:hypothetical protein